MRHGPQENQIKSLSGDAPHPPPIRVGGGNQLANVCQRSCVVRRKPTEAFYIISSILYITILHHCEHSLYHIMHSLYRIKHSISLQIFYITSSILCFTSSILYHISVLHVHHFMRSISHQAFFIT